MYDMAMRLLAISMLLLLPLAALNAQENQDKAKKQMPPPSNLKVLKVTTGPQVVAIMRTFTAGLGVQCVYCHVQGNFASDDNPKKNVARGMITMVKDINSKMATATGETGKEFVTCYTCHRGKTEPDIAPAQ